MFQFAQSLLDYVLHRAERFYDEQCAFEDPWGYVAGEFGPYDEYRDYGSVDWWSDCCHFQDAMEFVIAEAFDLQLDREYKVRCINNRNPDYGVLRNA